MALVILKIKQGLAKRGVSTCASFGRAFKNFDNDGNRKVTQDEFLWGLKDYQVDLTKEEVQQLFNHLDSNHDGVLNFDEFLVGMRGDLSDFRKVYVDKAYAKLDATGDGKVNIDDIKAVYSTEHHPEVVSGQKNSEQVYKEFLGSFGDDNHDGSLTKDEFYQYYGALSASVDND